ncbi:hypothetical protein LTR35_017667, partial [Friedmanniomyces endolithicus]
RDGGVISKYASSDAFFAFHQINAFEDTSGALIIDLPTATDYHFLNSAKVDNLRANVGPNANGSSYNDLTFNFTRYLLPNHGDGATFSNGAVLAASRKPSSCPASKPPLTPQLLRVTS